jgi:hypothetical protein
LVSLVVFFGTFSPFWYIVPGKIWQPWQPMAQRYYFYWFQIDFAVKAYKRC